MNATTPQHNWFRSLYDWVLSWSDRPSGPWALFVLAMAEASFFPIPPDVLLIALALGNKQQIFRFVALCTAGSVLGGVIGYAIGAFAFEGLGRPVLEWYGLLGSFDIVSSKFRAHAFWSIFIAAFTPIPFKVFTVAAGAMHVNMPVLIVASAVGRGARFGLVGWLIHRYGDPVKGMIERHLNWLTVVFVILLLGGFVVIRHWFGH